MKNRIFYFAVLPGLFFQFVGAYLYLVAFKGQDFSQLVYTFTKILLVVWPLLWLPYLKSFHFPFWSGNFVKSLKSGVVSGLLVVFLISAVYLSNSDFFKQFGPNLVKTAEGLNFLDYYFLFAFFLSVFHSFIEEYYWRWFVLNGLTLKMSRPAAVVVSSLAFASHHFIVVSQFVPLYLSVLATVLVFTAGFFWSRLYLRTGSIIGSWISHFFADVVIMTVGYFLMFGSNS